ncbi:MAG: hypothetical protein K2W82_16910 [Candidatus Obscuribacterales bacterium]|nr:hypothetical protein [Candidatus Obscuribacterales bacterium]
MHKKSRLALLAILVIVGVGAGTWCTFNKTEATPVIAATTPEPFDSEVVLLGSGEVQFFGYARGTMSIDGGEPFFVDGGQFKKVEPDGSFQYTALPTYQVKERAIVRLQHGDFRFSVAEKGMVRLENHGSLNITGNARCNVHKDGYLYADGVAAFQAENIRTLSIAETIRQDDGFLPIGSLHAKNCDQIVFCGKSLPPTSDHEVDVHYDQANDRVVTNIIK